MYYIGIDGGATKSTLVATDEKLNQIHMGKSGGSNLDSNSYEKVHENMSLLVHEFLRNNEERIENCACLCFGGAGIDYEENRAATQRIFESIGFTCPVLVINDGPLVLGGEPGVALISGTGAIAYGVNRQGEVARSGGRGHLLSDEGSGYWIGLEALRKTLQAYDGREEPTIMADLVPQALGVEKITDCGEIVYRHFDKSQIASLSMQVVEAAVCGDQVANDILHRAACHLCKLTGAVLKKLGNSMDTVIVSGNNLLKKEVLFQMYQEELKKKHPNIKIIKNTTDPAWGAAKLARNHLAK